jgi:hypothetical protein
MNQEVWFFQQGFYVIHIIDSKLKRKLDFLKNFKQINTYFYPNGVRGWDFLFPAKLYNKAVRWIKHIKAPGEHKNGTDVTEL